MKIINKIGQLSLTCGLLAILLGNFGCKHQNPVDSNGNNGGEITWQQTNGPSGGRIDALVIDDSGQIYAGSQFGVFYSTNYGENWQKAGLTDTPVQALAIDSNGNIFAGTTEGIYRSTNAGTNWEAVNSGLTEKNVNSIAAHPDEFIL
ncbi:MAG: hypothetical protein O7G31_09900, partial [Calditrichaeota bacterium]|nr:hypothetical protein [Calditrichota bacterium]